MDTSYAAKVKARLEDIKKNPQNHRHDFNGLHACSMIDGILDLRIQEAHSEVGFGTNGGVRCDVSDGPCACGAWH